jgi:hypothetical protein
MGIGQIMLCLLRHMEHLAVCPMAILSGKRRYERITQLEPHPKIKSGDLICFPNIELLFLDLRLQLIKSTVDQLPKLQYIDVRG